MKNGKQRAKERARIEMIRAQKTADWKRGFPPTLDDDFFKLLGTVTPQVAKPLLNIELEVYENIEQMRRFHVILDGQCFEFDSEELDHMVNTFKAKKIDPILLFKSEISYTSRQSKFITEFLVSAWDGLPKPGEIEKWEED